MGCIMSSSTMTVLGSMPGFYLIQFFQICCSPSSSNWPASIRHWITSILTGSWQKVRLGNLTSRNLTPGHECFPHCSSPCTLMTVSPRALLLIFWSLQMTQESLISSKLLTSLHIDGKLNNWSTFQISTMQSWQWTSEGSPITASPYHTGLCPGGDLLFPGNHYLSRQEEGNQHWLCCQKGLSADNTSC